MSGMVLAGLAIAVGFLLAYFLAERAARWVARRPKNKRRR